MKSFLSLAALSLMAGYAVAQTTAPPTTTTPQATEPPAAQQPSATPPSATKPNEQEVKSGNVTWYQRTNDDWPASEIIGTTVRNNAGESIGDVNELILANDGKVRAVVIGVGGFLGMGERDVAVAFDSLKITRDEDNDEVITIDTTKDALSNAPKWERRGTSG
ncbi:MAG: PRC-barrel domain-containing protein [Hyphomicrobium sp.]|nr:PRC-barrel domain-containing protein [Hyphomicrobium sp.]